MRVALVHDWFVESGGAEKVVAQILSLFPHADVFSTVDHLTSEQRDIILGGKTAHTTFIQKLPKSKFYKKYFALMPVAMESLDLSEYDVIISSSSSVGKGVITGPNQVHICYCHSPMRYAWDFQEQYLKESGLNKGFKGFLARNLLFFMRGWDVRSSFGVDHFIANSNYIAKRINKVYRRDAEVIYPNVEVEDFDCTVDKDDYYFTCSRMVPYKKIDLIVEAFSSMPDKKLVVIGDGPDMKKIREKSGENIELMGYQSFTVLKDKMAKAKAFVFAAEEDFGIVPVEAQACGTPVIAYGKGGALETVIDGETGTLFGRQDVPSIVSAVHQFETMTFDAHHIRKNAERFSTSIFNEKFKSFVLEKIKDQP
jgi:glycosyltransferase involved in cell wall biosynthesis